jgi:glutamate-1-semialdehyde 2,1-aminomutase
MLLSKRTEMHLPGRWPAYFSKAKGCQVWDLDGNEYLDVGWMAIGTNILGYGDDRVDSAVKGVVEAGNLSTLNCPEEVYLAERLCEVHPWADMARFTRSGGEACAVATRIARAASGKDGVAFCGYHGWHDWYLSANLAEDSALDGHLLPGLEPVGVPRGLLGTSQPFLYNDPDTLERLLSTGRFGVVFMEVERSSPPSEGFLEVVRRLADRYSAVLVFDECTSGFRKVLGGLHLHHGVEPDIAVLGKTLGNGYAINAVIGRESVMQAAQRTFISSTFWTERIGPTAALAALKAMEEDDAPRRIDSIGLQVQAIWESLAKGLGMSIQIGGLPALSTYSIEGRDPAVVKSFVVDRMLSRGFLSSTAVYASTAHTPEILERYAEALGDTWSELARLSDDEIRAQFTSSGLAHMGFSRLA